MRLGGVVCDQWETPEEWAMYALEMGYEAVYFPLDYKADIPLIDAYVKAAKENDLLIAEVGVWNNVLDSNTEIRKAALEKAVKQLELAEYVGACCCVNISGSRGTQWDGPHKDNFSDETFEMVVQSTQFIIDSVKPKKTFYVLEPMPWMFPYSAQSYLRLIKAIDREGFAAHIDMVNVISSPDKLYRNGEVIQEWFDLLGPYIKSCHAKDIRLEGQLTVHLNECRPGLGELDYDTLIRCINQLDKDVSLMLEHMDKKDDFIEGMKFLQAKKLDS